MEIFKTAFLILSLLTGGMALGMGWILLRANKNREEAWEDLNAELD